MHTKKLPEMSLGWAEHHLKGCSPSGSWRYHPCSLTCSISSRSLGSPDTFSLLPEKGRPIVLFYARQEEWIGLGLSFSLLA